MPIHKTKALLIDIDDTLLPEWDIAFPIWDEVCAEAAAHIGHDASALSSALKRTSQRIVNESRFADMARINYYDGEALLWDALDFDGPPVERLDAWLPEFRVIVWSEVLESLNVRSAETVTNFAHAMHGLGLNRRIPYSDAMQVLNYLAESYTLVAVTNGVPGVQARKIERHGFQKYCDHIVLAAEFGGKPSRGPFEAAMQLAEASAGECAMIGNSLSRDIKGAHGVGIRSVWINRNGETAEPALKPDIEIKALDELRNIF